jgi:hypothetical protein
VQIYNLHQSFLWINTHECSCISDATLEALAMRQPPEVKYVILQSSLSITDLGLAALAKMGATITHLELCDLHAASPHGWLVLLSSLPNLRNVVLSLRLPQHLTPSLDVLYARALEKLANCSPKLDRLVFSDCPGVSSSLAWFGNLKTLTCLEIIDCVNVGIGLIRFFELGPPALTTFVLQQSFGPEEGSKTITRLLQVLPPTLTSLYLSESCKIEEVAVEIFLKRCKLLERLTFHHCAVVSVTVLFSIARYAHRLTRLKIGDLHDLRSESVLRLVHLKPRRRRGFKLLKEVELNSAHRLRTSSPALDYEAIEGLRHICPALDTLYISGVRLSLAQNSIEERIQSQFPGFTLKLSESVF